MHIVQMCKLHSVSVVKSSYSDDEERQWKLMQVRWSHGERSWEIFSVVASRQSAWNIHQNASARLYNEPDVNTLRVHQMQTRRQTNQQTELHKTKWRFRWYRSFHLQAKCKYQWV